MYFHFMKNDVLFYLYPGNVLSYCTTQSVPLALLGNLPIGSIWENNVCNEVVKFQKKTFNINNSPLGWEYVNFDNNIPYNAEIYPLSYNNNDKKNWLISFNLANGGKLFVPCLEYYIRCYGASSEIKRTLLTYPWDNDGFYGQGKGDSLQKRIFSKLRDPILYDKKQVNLGTRLMISAYLH
jgi:hypothetical protein